MEDIWVLRLTLLHTRPESHTILDLALINQRRQDQASAATDTEESPADLQVAVTFDRLIPYN